MRSLQEICSRQAIVLAIDSASVLVQVGLIQSGREPLWESSREEAGISIFSATDGLLSRAKLTLDQVTAFIFCEGPGSILGIRLAAVALRTWSMLRPRPIFAYGSLHLVTAYQLHSSPGQAFSVIADARRDSWHAVTVGESGLIDPLRRVKLEALSGPLFMPENFRSWSPLSPDLRIVPYSVPTLFQALPDAPLFRETTEPDAFLHEEPTYQTWTPRVHRAPS